MFSAVTTGEEAGPFDFETRKWFVSAASDVEQTTSFQTTLTLLLRGIEKVNCGRVLQAFIPPDTQPKDDAGLHPLHASPSQHAFKPSLTHFLIRH